MDLVARLSGVSEFVFVKLGNYFTAEVVPVLIVLIL